jgi:hypothetical protein
MFTSKPMYKENKLWSSLFLPPSKVPKVTTSQLVVFFWCPFSFVYVIASYCYYCCSYYSCSTKVEKEKEVVAIQKHKKLTSKRNLRNSKPGKIYCFQH